MSFATEYKKKFSQRKSETLSMDEFLEGLKSNPEYYALPAERMLKAIGEPVLVDTAKDDRLGRIFSNRYVKVYENFKDFYGMEPVIENIVSFFKHAAQGLEESKQVLYLLGPVGSAKSSLAERLKELICKEPIYALEGSPIHESPLGLFDAEDAKSLGVDARYLKFKPSPWALKRLEEFDGDISKFKVVKIYPDESHQIAVCKTEPGDENNQDISTLVGKVDIRKLENLPQDDTDAYSYSGGLCRANQGMLEFVEMFKAPIKMLHPLLTATQEGNYKGTEAIPAIPFNGIILAHSNESEWSTFRLNKNNEAFLDRISIVKVPYCLRVDEEIEIYKKLIKDSNLHSAVCAPGTKRMLAEFCVLSRLDEPKNSTLVAKMRVYNGENTRGIDTKAKSLQEYKDVAQVNEGFTGVSTRHAFKILSKVYNYDVKEIAANPVHMLLVLNDLVESEGFECSEDETTALHALVHDYLKPEYSKRVGKDIQTAYLDSYAEYGQNLFDRYFMYVDHWLEDKDYRDPETGIYMNKEQINRELEKIEKPADIANPKDFRQEVFNFNLRHRSRNKGKNVGWMEHEKIKEVIEENMFSKTEELLPVISFGSHGSKDDKKKHEKFVDNMVEMGYTKRQVRLVVEWHQSYLKSQ